jgi:hypothetical protein
MATHQPPNIMALLKFKTGVHLSEAFGKIKHGEGVRDISRGAIAEIKSAPLAKYLVENEWAEVQIIESSNATKP